MVYSLTKEPLIKRLPPFLDQTYGVQNYGADNLYPQRAEEVGNRSYTTKKALEKTADFIYGKGFEDPILSNLVINSSRQTWNKVLSFLSKDKAFIGMALHFKYNPFTYKITDINFTEFNYCRLGLPDDDGNVADIKYHINWELDPNKTLDKTFEPEAFPVFDPRPEIVKAQMEEYGWDCYPGQILYWTPKPGVYPLCAFDPAFDDAQTQSEIGVFQLAGLQNGFMAQHIFKYPGQFETDEKRAKFKKGIAEFQGAQANGSMLVLEVPDTEKPSNVVETLQMQNTDKMHEFTSKNVKNAIRETMAVPAPIMGQLPEAGMFNQEDILNSYIYFNESTGKHRDEISEVVKEIMTYWHQPVAISSYNILPRTYGQASSASPGTNKPGAANPTPGAAPDVQASPRLVDDRLARLSAAEDANLERTMRKVKKGKMTKEAGILKLKMSFGFTDEEANAFLS